VKTSVPRIGGCRAPVLAGQLGREDAEHLAEAFRAIADPARLRLLNFIAAQPAGEACVCHLTEPLGLSQPTVSHHLKVLFTAGLLRRERRGTWAYYRIVPDELAALRDALAAPAATPRRGTAGAR
jgi:ArsR family transcriptional regulator